MCYTILAYAEGVHLSIIIEQSIRQRSSPTYFADAVRTSIKINVYTLKCLHLTKHVDITPNKDVIHNNDNMADIMVVVPCIS